MAELIDKQQELTRENTNLLIINSQLQTRLGVLETENVRLRKKFNEIKDDLGSRSKGFREQ